MLGSILDAEIAAVFPKRLFASSAFKTSCGLGCGSGDHPIIPREESRELTDFDFATPRRLLNLVNVPRTRDQLLLQKEPH